MAADPFPTSADADGPTDAVDVVVLGSANLDLVATTDRLPGPGETVLGHDFAEHPGGKGLNQAVAAARAGSRVAFVGALGNDAAGDQLRAVLADEGIDATPTIRTTAPTGRALITVDGHGENSIVVVPGANATVRVDAIPACHVVLAQLEVPAEVVRQAFVLARAAGATTILNPAPAPQQLDDELLALVDVLVPNQHERELLGGAAELQRRGVPAVVTTLGTRGAEVHDRMGVRSIHPFHVDAVDTTAAGDAFCGVLAARRAAGDTLDHACRWAAAAGALAATHHGAVPSLPHRARIAALAAGTPGDD